jgi:hypothetical protein
MKRSKNKTIPVVEKFRECPKETHSSESCRGVENANLVSIAMRTIRQNRFNHNTEGPKQATERITGRHQNSTKSSKSRGLGNLAVGIFELRLHQTTLKNPALWEMLNMATIETEDLEAAFLREYPLLHRVADANLDKKLRARVSPSDVVQDAWVEAVARFGEKEQTTDMT